MAFPQSIISPDRKVSLNPRIISRNVASCDQTWSLQMKITGHSGRQPNIHHEVFSSYLANCEILLQSGAGWQIWGAERSCTNIGFSTSALSRGDRIWRKRTIRYGHLAVDISWCRASNCAGKPPLVHQCQWEDQFHAIVQEKKGLHRQKARIHIQKFQIRSVGRTFRVVDKTQNLCFAGPPRDQVRGCWEQVFLCSF